MKGYPDHGENLVSLKRIEGQVRGIQNMIKERKYCIDILIQLRAVILALAAVEEKILEKHFRGCVTDAVSGKSMRNKEQKLKEILQLIHRFRNI